MARADKVLCRTDPFRHVTTGMRTHGGIANKPPQGVFAGAFTQFFRLDSDQEYLVQAKSTAHYLGYRIHGIGKSGPFAYQNVLRCNGLPFPIIESKDQSVTRRKPRASRILFSSCGCEVVKER